MRMQSIVSLARIYNSSAIATNTMYQLIGGELSPYTAKVRFYLRHKNIPFDPVQASAEIYIGFVKPRVGWTVIPVLVTPDNQVIQDSTKIISYLESRHPEPSILPDSSKQKIVASLLELFSDEWLVQPSMHYRWNFPESQSKYLDEEFGRVGFPKFPVEERASIAGNVYEKFKGMLPVIGITSTTGPEIEKSWKALLDDMTAHFDKHPYFLGGKPCIGDFAVAGMFHAHLLRDPVPGYIMRTRAPVVAAWTESMNGCLPHANKLHLHNLNQDGRIVREILPESDRDFVADDEIPETLLPILKRFFTEFGPILLSTKVHLSQYIKENVTPENTKLPRVIGTHRFRIGNVAENRQVIPFNMWKWQQVNDIYCSLPIEQRVEVDHLLAQFPHGLDVVKASLDSCRVERVNNFLHAKLPPKASL